LTVGLVTLGACYYGLEVRHPGWVRDLRQALCQRTTWEKTIAREEQENLRLLGQEERVLSRLEQRWQIARDVADGKLTLADAGQRFRLLAEEAPARNLEQFRRDHPGASEEELFLRQVLLFVEMEIRDRPDGFARLERLQRELDESREKRLFP
jgi:hypothetical protein